MNAYKSRAEELKELAWDSKIGDEIQKCCEMVNPTCSASLIYNLTKLFKEKMKWLLELQKIEPGLKVLDYAEKDSDTDIQ